MLKRNVGNSPIGTSAEAKTLWNDAWRHSTSLGCSECRDLNICGGLQTEHAIFSCLDHCCGSYDGCDVVCPNNPQLFAKRIREVGGLQLDNVPRTVAVAPRRLPDIVPLIYHGNRRSRKFSEEATVCFPLFRVVGRADGEMRFKNKHELIENFRVGDDSEIILSGTEKDAPLERWWDIGLERRRDMIRNLREIGVTMVTAPNYSLFTDRPRWDDLHSMKRIALVHHEFQSSGIPAALHVNARTESDWERWSDYVAARSEITHLAFEFGTGAGWERRIGWHVCQLTRLSRVVGRPLHLVVRGGYGELPRLRAAFTSLTLIETTTFFKSMKRQGSYLTDTGEVVWKRNPTAPQECLDDLLESNWRNVRASFEWRATRAGA